jgi:hypothetical protein
LKFGEVWQAIYQEKIVAVKTLQRMSNDQEQELLDELGLLG